MTSRTAVANTTTGGAVIDASTRFGTPQLITSRETPRDYALRWVDNMTPTWEAAKPHDVAELGQHDLPNLGEIRAEVDELFPTATLDSEFQGVANRARRYCALLALGPVLSAYRYAANGQRLAREEKEAVDYELATLTAELGKDPSEPLARYGENLAQMEVIRRQIQTAIDQSKAEDLMDAHFRLIDEAEKIIAAGVRRNGHVPTVDEVIGNLEVYRDLYERQLSPRGELRRNGHNRGLAQRLAEQRERQLAHSGYKGGPARR